MRYLDEAGEPREKLFERKTDAESWDLLKRSGIVSELPVESRAKGLTFRDYAERWKESRESGWATETRKRVPGNLRDHLYPYFGDLPIRQITLTDILLWLSNHVDHGTPKNSINLYFGLIKASTKRSED